MVKPTKAATKGQKQIYLENKSTIQWYLYMSSITLLTNIGLTIYLWPYSITWGYVILTFLSIIIRGACLACMKWMAGAKFNERGAVIDAGMDLNMEGGFPERIKDLVIITSACQILTLYSIYFWWLLISVPTYAIYLFWVNIAAPWIFAPAPEETEDETDEKKRRKLMRKQQRVGRFARLKEVREQVDRSLLYYYDYRNHVASGRCFNIKDE